MMSNFSNWRVLPAIALLGAFGLAGCEQKSHAAAAAPKEVEALAVKTESFTVIDELPGRIEPVRVAQVRARVAGIVLTRNFEEGADVKAGAVLFQIDPAPFKAALAKAQGDLARTEATLFETQATVKRYESLVEIEAVSRQTFDTARSALLNAAAARKSAQADVETARLNLATPRSQRRFQGASVARWSPKARWSVRARPRCWRPSSNWTRFMPTLLSQRPRRCRCAQPFRTADCQRAVKMPCR